MKLTNRLGLPRSIENAVRRDPYTLGSADISVTGLISPARKRVLEMRHNDELSEDVAERIWSLLGQVCHGILERAEDQAMTEKRLYIQRYGWSISGQFDHYLIEPTGKISDYKLTSCYAIKDGCKPEWEQQQNIYAIMLQEHGYKVQVLEIVAILRDWKKAKAKRTPDYPQFPAVIIPVPLWGPERTEQYIKERLIAHGSAQHELPECTAEERWEKPGVWAVQKAGGIRAVSLHDTEEDAKEAAATLGAKYTVIERPAVQKRCEDYCSAISVCDFGKSLVKKTEEFHANKNVWIPGKKSR